MTSFRTAALLLALTALPAYAQPDSGKVQPDRIDFGTVYTGTTIEASFLVFEAGTDPKIKFEVTAPEFLKVLGKTTHAQQVGPGHNFIGGSGGCTPDTPAAAAESSGGP